MGGKSSKKLWEHGTVQVTTTNGHNFIPGQVITGQINANFNQPYHTD